MANQNRPYYPAQATITANANTINIGPEKDGYGGTGNNLFDSGNTEAFIEDVLVYKFKDELGNYFMHTFLKYFDSRSFPVHGVEHAWYEMGRTRIGLTVNTSGVISGDGTATLVVEDAATDVKYQVGDVLKSPRGWTARIEAVNTAGANPQYSLVKTDGTNWDIAGATEVADDDILGHNHNRWGEMTGQPGSRKWRPEMKTNKLAIAKATYALSGDAYTTKSELQVGNNSVWAEEEMWLTAKEFMRDRENILMWAEETADDNAHLSGRGIVPDIIANASASTTYTALAETDFQSQILKQNVLTQGSYFLLLGGQEFIGDSQNVLKDYVMDGAVNYGTFGSKPALAVGLGIRQYHFLGKVIEMVNYQGFDDRDVTGYAGAASAAVIDYRNFGLLLNLGSSGGNASMALDGASGYGSGGRKTIPYLSYAYKSLGGVNRALVTGKAQGMTGKGNSYGGDATTAVPADVIKMLNGNTVSTDVDADYYYLLSQIGARMACVDVAHGFMRKTA